MTAGAIAAIVYGLLSIIGGIIGYKQANSKPSLISGIISGILLILGAILSLTGATWGIYLAIAVTAILVIVFSYRLVKTRKFFPAGLMIIVGVIALILMFQAPA